MLRKIISVKGVGTFEAFGCKGDVTFRPFTAIWGPNGAGKSTICDILRSYGTNDPAVIVGRTSLTGGTGPDVELLFEEGKRVFRSGAWDTSSSPNILVFDSYYIHENVFVGDYVEHDQKKNLYRVIVGDHGVTLARNVDELDARHREATKDAGARRDAIKASLPAGLSVEAFLSFDQDPMIVEKIAMKEKDISALEQSDSIAKRPLLAPLPAPEVPPDIDAVLSTTIDGVSSDAERLVREHLATRHVRESWLSEGLRAVRDDECPFCGQPAGATDLLSAYRAYFSESYGALKEKVAARRKEIEAVVGQAAAQRLHTAMERNRELGDEWVSLVGEACPSAPDVTAMEALREQLTAALQTKEAAPLEAVGPVMHGAVGSAYGALLEAITRYNDLITSFNAKAQQVKDRTKLGDLQHARRDLDILRAHQRRFEASTTTQCDAYRAATKECEDVEKQKSEAKKALDGYAASILGSYQEAINRYLQKFGADFRIKKLERRYAGGSPSSSYVIEIKNAVVELGDRKTSRSERSFRNTLSGGDRSALALAFFLAQLERDTGLTQKIVVLDDPFTSQDRGRRLATQQEIRRLRGRAVQVIVLSHDDAFLRECCAEVDGAELKTLQLRRGSSGPQLDQWDITAPMGQGLQDRQHLKEFLADGCADPTKLRDVARKIRPLLEAHLRGRFMGKFQDGHWLGDMIGILRENADKLSEGQALPDELGAINEFSRRYHHAQNPGADTEPIDEIELRAFAERAIDLADGF
jgi:wobble nucleotide-excising tRNase